MKETETGLNVIALYPVQNNLFFTTFLVRNFPFVFKYKAMKAKGNHQQNFLLVSLSSFCCSPVIFRNVSVINARCLNETFTHTR